MTHLVDAAKDSKNIMIRTTDTDVVVLAVASASRYPDHEIWVAMGVGKDFRHIPAHIIARNLGPTKSSCLPLFHSFTGWDTVSFFNKHQQEEGLGGVECLLMVSRKPSFGCQHLLVP